MAVDQNYVLSLNRDFNGPEDSVIKIYLENGQLDDMPRFYCVARRPGISVGLHYFRTAFGHLFWPGPCDIIKRCAI